MRCNGVFIGLRAALTIFAVVLFVASTCAAQQETVLHSFGNGTDATHPLAGLIFDAAGNLYGTAWGGGIHGDGAVFEMSPNGAGGYTVTVLHSFGNGTDGQIPFAVNLIFDAAGNLYGTTQYGGTHGSGTVFEMSPNGAGGWTETVLHSFGNGTDGKSPLTGLIFDATGNLYGTTSSGGLHGLGTAYEMSPNGAGGWTETTLYNFGNGPQDGQSPRSGLIFDGAGNLYGVAKSGGIHALGTAYELSPNGSGGWTETTLHSFGNGTDGATPLGGLVFDASGNLYGTTFAGGIHPCGGNGCGTVFELSPRQGGGYTEMVLHSFGNGTDGTEPQAGLISDTAGNLYSTTEFGGIHNEGTVFELSPREGGGWTETVLHSFGRGTDAATPLGGLIFDAAGNLYGTTFAGGIHCGGAGGCGTVFEITP